jgi:hypothetical protein
MIFINGYSLNCVQSEFAKIISGEGQTYVNSFNTGNGFNGCFISIVCYVFYLIYWNGVVRKDLLQADILAKNFNIMMGFLVVYAIVAVLSFVMVVRYNQQYPKLLSSPEVQMTNRLQEQVKAQQHIVDKTFREIIIDNIEIYVTMIVQYYFLIINLTYFVVHTTFKQNDDPVYCIPFFFLMYNIGDFLGKFIPAHWTSSDPLVMYLISLFFPLLTIYFNAYAFFSDKGSFIQSV